MPPKYAGSTPRDRGLTPSYKSWMRLRRRRLDGELGPQAVSIAADRRGPCGARIGRSTIRSTSDDHAHRPERFESARRVRKNGG